MNKKEIARRTTDVLRKNGIKKHIRDARHTFHITDGDGNVADFVVRRSEREVLFTMDDVEAIITAALAVAEDEIKHGGQIYLHGFGILKLLYRKERSAIHPTTRERVIVPGHYLPKFYPGDLLRTAAKVYELSLSDGHTPDEIEIDENFDDFDLEDIDVDAED